MTELLTPENLIALLTLTSLEIVLGIDNIVFIAIVSQPLPEAQRSKARKIGLGLAMIQRVILLFCISWIIRLTEPLITLFEKSFSGRDLILLLGGLFLIGKATWEIHGAVEGTEHGPKTTSKTASMGMVLFQIAILDTVFSLDSVITAVGMVDNITIMVTAVVISIGIMMAFANSISDFIIAHPTIKVLALSFLLLIGVVLMADGLGRHIEKGYIYFAMGFAVLVEFLNFRIRKKAKSKAALKQD